MTRAHRIECVAAGTLITTDQGLIPAARLARMRQPPLIVGFDHISARFVLNRMTALRTSRTQHLREIITENGRSLWCTHDHPVYIIGRGYVAACTVRPGSEVLAAAAENTPMHTRQFVLPWLADKQQQTRPDFPAPVGKAPPERSPLPIRRRDWVRGNRVVRTDRVHTVFDFQVDKCPNFVADGVLVHNCLMVGR